MDLVIIDMQFFKQGQDLLCKEIAHISLNEKSYSPAVALFEAPFNWNLLCHSDKLTNRFLMFNYTKILWTSGNIPYDYLQSYFEWILQPYERIILKGVQKKRWLEQRIFGTTKLIYDLTGIQGCPSIKSVKSMHNTFSPCSNHHPS